MDVVLTLLLSFSTDTASEQTTIPKWLAALMLVAEALLSLSEDPRSITLPKEGDPIVAQEILTGPPYDKARTVLFDFSLRLLALPGLPRDELLASLRLLVFMTRDHDLAMQFVKRDGVPLLFKSLKSSSGGVAGSQSYVSIILRHIVEDPVVVRHIMREEVQRSSRTHALEQWMQLAMFALATRWPFATPKHSSTLPSLSPSLSDLLHTSAKFFPRNKTNRKAVPPPESQGRSQKPYRFSSRNHFSYTTIPA
jgi:hypothetical protein